MKQVVMLGPSPAARGGMATVIATLLEHGYEADGRCRFIATHVDGSPARKAARALAALGQVTFLLARGKVALLHVHVASGVSFWRKAAFIGMARLFRCPVLFHLHGGEFREFIEQRLPPRRRRLALSLIRGSAAAFALTTPSADWLRAYCGLARVEVFPNPIGGPVRDPAVARAGRGDEILFLGRLEEKKGVFDLLRAFAIVHAARPAQRLVLAGDGDQAPVRALARELGVEAAVDLPGWVGPARRTALMNRAALFVLASHHEQMPMAILEAMASGTAILATNVGAVADMLAYSNSESVVPVKEIAVLAASILRILTDNIRTDTLAMRGLEKVKSEYIVETVILRLRRRYEELAA